MSITIRKSAHCPVCHGEVGVLLIRPNGEEICEVCYGGEIGAGSPDAVANYLGRTADPNWCYTCDRPKNDCGCVENGGNY